MTPLTHTRGWYLQGSAPADGANALVWQDNIPLPPLAENDVLVKFYAWSVNYPELAIANGSYPWLPENPAAIPGSDAAGEIIATGSNAKRFRSGDRVFPVYYPHFDSGMSPTEETSHDIPGLDTSGVFREYAIFNERALAKAPSNLSYEETASLVCSGLTAWNALYGCNPIKAGSWVLVQGTGGVSMFAVQFALAAGATVIATTSSDAKAKMLKDLGVHHVLDYKQDTNWGETARKLTPRGLGCDHVIEVGGPSTINETFKCVARGGVIDVIGFLSGQENVENSPSWIKPLIGACIVRGVEVGNRQQIAEMVRAIEGKDIKPVMDSEAFTLRQMPDVYRRVWAGKHMGKAVVSGV